MYVDVVMGDLLLVSIITHCQLHI